MDIENCYFLAKFQSFDDYPKVLSQGPWVIYGQYLIVQPWTKIFSPSQPYTSMVLAWIRLPGLPGLPGFLYKKKIIEEIGKTIGKMVRLYFNIDSKTRGRFARLAVYVNLDEPLIAQVLVNGMLQKVEYEGLPTICFTCGRYELCASKQSESASGVLPTGMSPAKGNSDRESKTYGPWMIFEKKSKRNFRASNHSKVDTLGGGKSGSRFDVLINKETLFLEEESIKEKERQLADFREIMNAGKFIDQLRAKNWDEPSTKGRE
ncbi:hypothetical protein J1N35_018730 [Gossypium stocksii]|uniref:DUF4283 domain-containing protein n=1 Tax=Gossypium stocksii TaxID=47602 RepID=A0A9D3VRS0_9ROSI|nr:hypothetical protein J1N35_018730 [Gossypium stocksii]